MTLTENLNCGIALTDDQIAMAVNELCLENAPVEEKSQF